MTGWETKADNLEPRIGTAPTPVTLTEIAAQSQRQQLTQLAEALEAHADLAARVYAAMRRSP